MADKGFYTIKSISDALNIDESTLREWHDQYETWIPYAGHGKNRRYPQMAIEVLRLIARSSEAKMSSDEIESLLQRSFKVISDAEGDVSHDFLDIALQVGDSGRASSLFRKLIEDFSEIQKRIAAAQERRAIAEERKASALEKQAEIERFKVEALNNIVKAIQGGGPIRSFTAVAEDIDPDTVAESSTASLPIDDMGIELSPYPAESSDVAEEAGEERLAKEIDLSERTAAGKEADRALDLTDLSDLLETGEPLKLQPDLIDLSELVEERETAADSKLADLSELIDTGEGDIKAQQTAEEMGIAEMKGVGSQPNLSDLNDLLAGLDQSPSRVLATAPEISATQPVEPAPDLTNLSEMVLEYEAEALPQKDGLNAAAEPIPVAPEKIEASASRKITDVKQTATPPPNKNEYKKTMMALIIKMKEQEGLNMTQTAKRLNDEGYKTISGKGSWNEGMISKIYSHIETVRAKGDA